MGIIVHKRLEEEERKRLEEKAIRLWRGMSRPREEMNRLWEGEEKEAIQLWDEMRRPWEEMNRLWEGEEKPPWEEEKPPWKEMNRLWEEANRLWEEGNTLWEEHFDAILENELL
jgi:hypothetical protein